MKHVSSATIAAQYGFSSRHWIRQASSGKVPGAYQPSGQGGKWLFDAYVFDKWFKAKNRRVIDTWQNHTKEVKSIGVASKEKAWNTAPPLRQQISELLKSVSKNGSQTLRGQAGESANVLHLQKL